MLCERLDPGRVLELVEADDVAVEPGQRGEELVALAVELERLVGVGAAAVEVGVAAARPGAGVARGGVERDEEVERVHRRDPERAAHRRRRGRARVGRQCSPRRPVGKIRYRLKSKPSTPTVFVDEVAAAEPVAERERLAVRVAQDTAGSARSGCRRA